NYKIGTVQVCSNLCLELEAGSRLLGSENEDDFFDLEELDFTSHADIETTYFQRAILFGNHVENVTIRGAGASSIIDGNRLKRGGHKVISLKSCTDIMVRDLTLKNAPNYAISFLDCEHITCDNLKLLNTLADGIDLDNSRFARISNCYLDCNDDAICLKSSPALGDESMVRHIAVINCQICTTANCIKLGTETACDVSDVVVSNCTFFRRPFAKRANSGISIETVDGARVKNFVISNIVMENQSVRSPIYIRLGSRCRPVPWADEEGFNRWEENGIKPPGTLDNIIISNVIAREANKPIIIEGIKNHWIDTVQLNNILCSFVAKDDDDCWPDGKPPEEAINVPKAYPSPKAHKPLPAWGAWVRHARNVTFNNCEFTLLQKHPEDHPAGAIVAVETENVQKHNVRTKII
ncbi:MAG: glycoside hydrolase family 28 protein, partial [Promethearchaeota archaeon]